MNGVFDNKKHPRRDVSNHVPMLGVPATPPSGDNSEYRFLYLYDSIIEGQCQ